jgi:hypothetical protein
MGRADDGYDVRVVSRNDEPATTGIDLAFALVEDDYGAEVEQTVARWLVLYLRRPGGQTQFAAPVWMPRARRAPIRDVQEAIDAEPAGAHSIPELARRASMSPRHFTHRGGPSPVRGDRGHGHRYRRPLWVPRSARRGVEFGAHGSLSQERHG